LDNPNTSKNCCDADNEFDIELGNRIKASESPEHHIVSAAPTVPGLIWPTWRLMKQAEQGLMTVSAMETKRNKGNKKKLDRSSQYVFTRLFDQEYYVEKFHGSIVSSPMRMIVHK